ncbi:hypothetical protein JHK86_004991 [Glycine max]|nr:hypothetical protein JHK86_004991 [Glycine max]
MAEPIEPMQAESSSKELIEDRMIGQTPTPATSQDVMHVQPLASRFWFWGDGYYNKAIVTLQPMKVSVEKVSHQRSQQHYESLSARETNSPYATLSEEDSTESKWFPFIRPSLELLLFLEAPAFRSGKDCGSASSATINVAMTLDINYLCGTMLHHSILLLSGPHRQPGLIQGLLSGLGYLVSNPVGVKPINLHLEVKEGGLNVGEEFGSVVMGEEEVQGQVLGARRMLNHGEHRGHGATEVVGVEGHGYVNGGGGRGVAVFAVAEDRGLRRRTTGNNNLTVLNNFNESFGKTTWLIVSPPLPPHLDYPDSVESSLHSRNTNYWDEPFTPTSRSKLRFAFSSSPLYVASPPSVL